jgi:hypothetical protein
MNLQERGLWITLYMEFWVNGSMPADINELAKLLGFTTSDIEQSLSKLQYSFIENINGELICKELEEYRQGYLERREKQRLGGLIGAERKKAKKKSNVEESQWEGRPKGIPNSSLTYIKSNSINSNQLISKGVVKSTDPWLVAAFDDEPSHASNDYAKQSKGY